MWTPIRAVVVEDEPLAAQYLATLLDETWQVTVIGIAADAGTALALCAEQRPDAVFLDICLPGQDGMSLAAQLGMLPQPPRLVFTTGQADHAVAAFRLEAVDYLLKPLDPEQVTEAVKRLAALLRPFEVGPNAKAPENRAGVQVEQTLAAESAGELLSVKDTDRDTIRLLARNEVVAVLRRARRSWVHTVREEFATYYPLADLLRWLGGAPFLHVGRHAVINLHAIDTVNHYGDRLYRVRLRDRAKSEVRVSRAGAARLAAALKRPHSFEVQRADGF